MQGLQDEENDSEEVRNQVQRSKDGPNGSSTHLQLEQKVGTQGVD